MPDTPPPKRDKDRIGAIAAVVGYASLIVFIGGVLGLDDPRLPDQYFSSLYWGRKVHQIIGNLFED